MHNRRITTMCALGGLLAAAPAAIAAGGGGGGGGGTTTCAPLTTLVAVGHSDSGESAVGVTATVRNCGVAPQQRLNLNVRVPNSGTVPANRDLAEQPDGSLTFNAGPIGSTPSQLHYGQTYSVLATLTDTSTSPATVIATTTTTVTMPAGKVR